MILGDTHTNPQSNGHRMEGFDSQQYCSITNLNIYLRLCRNKIHMVLIIDKNSSIFLVLKCGVGVDLVDVFYGCLINHSLLRVRIRDYLLYRGVQ